MGCPNIIAHFLPLLPFASIIVYFLVIYVFYILLLLVQIEMMSESIDETLDKDEAEEETEELTNQVEYSQPEFLVLIIFLLGPCYFPSPCSWFL